MVSGATDPRRLGRAALPILALLVPSVSVAAVLASAGETLGYDFLAYHAAAERVLDGGPLYDLSFDAAGGFGLFYYPPTFALLVLPFGLLGPEAATWAWIALLGVAFVLGVALLPVPPAVRWAVLILAGISWPFVYAMKLGQVGPLLFLAFAVGWRWLADGRAVGLAGAAGAAIKIQPGIVLVWALLTRRWVAVVVGSVALAVLAVAATLAVGVGAWADYLTLLGRVGDPIATPDNLTPGAIAHRLGLAADLALWVQLFVWVAVVAGVLAAIRWGSAVAGYLSLVAASQLLSPILWDHYAMLLLLPVAFLLARGHWWAAAIPVLTAWPLVGLTPGWLYPVLLGVGVVAPALVDRRGAVGSGAGAVGSGALASSSGSAR